ncbi:MAG: transglutaminase family protein [Verrucomicrobia bacterium]|nr:transglutaminase family protein [Verrucomicrobiota bacterium]
MNRQTFPEAPPLDLTVRVGCKVDYETSVETPVLVVFKPRQDEFQSIRQESMRFDPDLSATEFEDDHQNIVYRLTLRPGLNTIQYDAIVKVPGVAEDFYWLDEPVPPYLLPASVLRYTLPSRYCDSDKLLDFAWDHFGHLEHGLPRVLGICQWLHDHIEYRTFSGDSSLSAFGVIQRGYGVCRDLAHAVVALCRTFNLPARYVSGFVPDIGFQDPGSPNDFHAYCEVFLGGRWQIFDARYNTPRIGRIRIASGYDAVNCAFTTLYGQADLKQFDVWAYQVDPAEVRTGDPVDLSKRLCGTSRVIHPPHRPAQAATI